MELTTRKNPMKKLEIVFDITYLLIVLISAAFLYKTGESGSLRWKFALMSFLLGLGDAFHLLPRMAALVKPEKDYTVSLGIGKFVTSITMTIFYIFLWEIGKVYYGYNPNRYLSLLVYGLALVRIGLCFFPQNQWKSKDPSLRWGIIRNIPFLILGIMVMILFLMGGLTYGGSLSYLWLAILLSFAFYMPVVLYAKKYPKIGMLMLPKSCAYVAIVLMGFSIL